MKETFTLQFDGGSRGNPGPAGIGVVVQASDGTPVVTLGRFIGRATNNVAEYRALITAMREALRIGATNVIIRGDSELIVRQMNGQYKVKNPDLKLLYDEAQDVLREFESSKIEHNLRHKNAIADKLANLAMDRKRDVTDVTGEATASAIDEAAPEPTTAGDVFVCARCGCAIRVDRPSNVRPHQLKPFVCQCGNKMASPRNRGEM